MPEPGDTFRLRRAGPGDLDAVAALERDCFEPERRSSRAVLRRSLRSPRQEVWLLDAGRPPAPAAMVVVWRHPRTTRVYSLAVRAEHRGRGLGERLMHFVEEEARRAGTGRVVLEADANLPRLVSWYEGLGYRVVGRREDYYAPGRPAVRMEKRLDGNGPEQPTRAR